VQPADNAEVWWRRKPGQPVLTGADALDIKLLARRNSVGFA